MLGKVNCKDNIIWSHRTVLSKHYVRYMKQVKVWWSLTFKVSTIIWLWKTRTNHLQLEHSGQCIHWQDLQIQSVWRFLRAQQCTKYKICECHHHDATELDIESDLPPMKWMLLEDWWHHCLRKFLTTTNAYYLNNYKWLKYTGP